MNKATLARIVSLLHERGPLELSAIAEALQLHDALLHDCLDALVKRGIVGEMPDGRFILTDWTAARFARAAEVVAANIASEVDG